MELTGLYSNLFSEIIKFKKSLPLVKPAPAKDNITDKTSINKYGETEVRQYRQKQKILSDDEREQVAQRYQAGESTYQLSRAFDCHRSTISRILKAAGVKVDQHRVDDDIVIKMYESGSTSTAIAKKYDVSPSVILKVLHKHNVRMRTCWESRTK